VVRLGGDEFVVLLSGVGAEEAAVTASRMISAVRDTDWSSIGQGLRVTVSIGTSTARTLRDAAELLAAADEAMYVAKRAGGDRRHTA
jgi:diguanylate cyclase (GGDEF)-like protein